MVHKQFPSSPPAFLTSSFEFSLTLIIHIALSSSQILEDGRLTDSKGRTVSFKNTLIIMTSNVGASVIEKGGRNFGFFLRPDDDGEAEADMSYNRIKTLVGEELKSYFRPEFLNRLDEIIVFRQLTKKEVKQIADIFLRDVFKRADEKGIKIEVTEKFKDRWDSVNGIRPRS